MASEQDISLVFGVQMEGSGDGPGSVELITRQLNTIVSTINKEPFKIKFEADTASLETIKSRLQEITNLTQGKMTGLDMTGVGDSASVSHYIDDIVKSLGTMESTMKMALDTSTHSFGIFQDQLIEVNRLLDIISRKELEVYNSYGGYGGGMTSDEAADLRHIAANIQMMCDGLSEFKQILVDIAAIIQQINAKEFNITNKFSVGKMEDTRKELVLQRAEMIELYNVTERYSKVFQDVVGARGSNGVRAAMTSVTGGNDIYKMIYAFEKLGITMGQINKEKNPVNFDIMKRQLLELLNTYKNVLEYINAESDKKIALPSLAALDEDRAKLESFTETQDKYNQSMREATATAMGTKISSGSGSGIETTTNQVSEQIASMTGNVVTSLQDIKAQIESTFNLSSIGFDTSKVTEVFQSVITEFNSFKELVKAGIEELRQTAIEAFSSIVGKDGAFSSDSIKAYLKDLNEISAKQAEIQKTSESAAKTQKGSEGKNKSKSKEQAEEERVYALAISQRVKAQEDATKAEKDEASASESANKKKKAKEITERQFLDIYRQIHAALRENASAEGSEQFEVLSKKLELLNAVLQISHDRQTSLENGFRALGVTGLEALELLKTNMSAFNLQMEVTGLKGSTSAAQVYKSIAQMKTIVSENKRYAGTETYDAIADRMIKFDQAIKMVETDLISVDSALEAVGITSADAMNGTNVLINKFKSEIAGFTNLKEATSLLDRARTLLSGNDNLSNTSIYTSLSKDVEILRQAISKANSGPITLGEAFEQMGYKGQEVIERITLGMARFKDTMVQTGVSGSLSIKEIESKLTSMNNLLTKASKVDGVSSTKEYSNLQDQILDFRKVLTSVRQDGLSVAEALKKIGTNGKEFISKADDAASKLKLTLSSETPAAKALADAEAKASKEAKEYQTQLSRAFLLLTSMEDAVKRWTTASKGKTSASYNEIVNNVNVLRSLVAEYKSGAGSVSEFKRKLDNIQNSFNTNSEAIRSAGENTKSFSDHIKNITQRFGAWFGVTRIVMYVYRTLRQMVSASIELDDALTQLKVVTKSTDSVYSKFGDTIAEVAKRSASSISDIVDSTTVYARLGYSLEESAKIAEYTAKLQNVGDIEVADAQNAITAILKAYDNIDANHIEEVMNKLIATGNGFPISVSQIAEGMNNASSALAAAGNNFEQSVALLTAANTVTQDAAKASTGLRTIAARIRRTDTELDELGESMTSAKYDELIKSLAKLDIALVDSNNEYRATYDIMSDIAAQWDNMTSMEQSALAEAISGTRQQAIFFSIIEQFQEASGAMEAMANSAGVLDDAYSTYLDSTTAHINQFKASFQSLSSNAFNSKALSFVVDTGRAIVDFTNALTKVNLLLPGIISSIALIKAIKIVPETVRLEKEVMNLSAKLIVNKTVTDELKTSILGLTLAQKKRVAEEVKAAMSSGMLGKTEGNQILSTLELTMAEEALVSQNQKLGFSFKALATSIPFWGWVSIISSVVIAIIGLTKATEEEVNKLKDLSEEYEGFESKLKDYKDAIEEIDTSMGTEAEKVQQLNDLRKEMEITYGREIDIVNSTAEAHERLNEVLEDEEKRTRTDYLEDTLDDYEKYKALVEDVSSSVNNVDFKNGTKGFSASEREVSEQIQNLFDSFELDAGNRKSSGGAIYSLGASADTLIEQYNEVKRVYDQLYKIRENRDKDFTKAEEAIFRSVKSKYEALKEVLYTGENGDIEAQLTQRAKESAKALMEDNPQYQKSIEEWRTLLLGKTDGDRFVMAAINELIDEMIAGAIEAEDVMSNIVSDLDSVGDKIEGITESIKTANSYFEDLAKVIKNNNDADSFFTASEIIDFLEKYPELYDSIDEISDSATERVYGYKIEKEALEALKAAKLEEQRNAIIGSLQETQNLANDVRERLSGYEKELQGIQDVAEAKARIAELDAKIAYANAHLVTNGPNLPTDLYNQQKTKYNAYVQAAEDLEKYQKQIENARVKLALLGKTNDDVEGSTQDATKALNSEKDAIKDLSDELKKAQDSIDDLVKLTMDMIKKEKELQKEALKEQLDNYKKLIDRKKELIDLEKDQYDFQKDLKEQNKDLLEIQQELDALSVEGVNYSLEDMKRKAELEEKYAEQSEKRDDFLYNHEVDVRKDTLDKEKELFEDNINTQTKAIEDYLKHEGWIRQQAIDLINGKSQEFYNDLYNYTLTYTTKSDAEFTKLWNDAYSALEKYGNGQIDVSAVLAYLLYQIEDCDNKMKSLEESMNSAKNAASDLANTIASGMTDAARVTGVVLDNIEAINGATGRTQRHIPGTPLSTSVSSGHKYWSVPDLLPKYHSGGVVKSGGLNNYGEVLAKLMAGEVVITPNQAKNFISKTLPQLTASNITNNQMSPTISIGDINITGNADASTVSQLKEIQKDIVNSVFKAVNGQNNLYNGGKVRMA